MIYLSQLAVKLIYEFVAFWGQMYFEKENMDCERSVNSITLWKWIIYYLNKNILNLEVGKYEDLLSSYFEAHFLHLLHFLIRTKDAIRDKSWI